MDSILESEPDYGVLSYAQEGEDLLVRRLLNFQEHGFYVDVGAHHPRRFSNTYLFYLQGWRGVNIDASLGSMEPFRQKRPRDINLERAVHDTVCELPFYCFAESALNTFDAALARFYQSHGWQLVQVRTLVTVPLHQLLRDWLPPGQVIDFLTVDVEGSDLAVLRSNNWERFRPRLVLAEDLQARRWDRCGESPLARFLASSNYEPIAKTLNTVVFFDRYRPLPAAAPTEQGAGGENEAVAECQGENPC